jgi:hypothetical protein
MLAVAWRPTLARLICSVKWTPSPRSVLSAKVAMLFADAVSRRDTRVCVKGTRAQPSISSESFRGLGKIIQRSPSVPCEHCRMYLDEVSGSFA